MKSLPIIRTFSICIFVMVCLPAHAKLYKCEQGGQVVYQDAPCSSGVEKTVQSPASQPSRDPIFADIEERIEKNKRMAEELKAKSAADKIKRDSELRQWIADEPIRKAENERRNAEALKKFQKDQELSIAILKSCKARENHMNCTPSIYRASLTGMHKSDVINALGDPRTQSIGGKEVIYYTVSILEGSSWRSGKLQLILGVVTEVPSNPLGKSNRVQEANIY